MAKSHQIDLDNLQTDYSLKAIFKRYKGRIIATFSLLTFENIFKVLQPLVLGIAINDLMAGSNNGLWMFCSLYLAGFIVGTIRRYYDTRAYTFIYTDVATEIAELQNRKGVEVSSIAARSALVKELIDFFEHDVTQAFTSLITVVGALVMLALFDWWIFAACLVAVLLIVLIYALSQKRIYGFNVQLNDDLEQRVKILEKRQHSGIFSHYKNIARYLVKLSDQETINFSIIEVILFGLAIFTLYTAASAVGATAGGIFAILTYVLDFSMGIFMLPIVYQQLIRLKEISSRLRTIGDNKE